MGDVMKHKHADLIHAWADGAQIQIKEYDGNWLDIEMPSWMDDVTYRIKPEPKPDIVIRFYLESHPWVGHRFSEAYTDNDLINKHSVIMCTFDGESRTLKAVEVLK
jgi:hypothetical protein